MAAQKTPTFDDVDKHVKDEMARYRKHTTVPGTAAATGPAQVCNVYMIVKPILQFVAMGWFFPATWRDAMNLYIKAMDVICPFPQA